MLERFDRHKNNKFGYYLKNYLNLLLPHSICRHWLPMAPVTESNRSYIEDRVNYYHQLVCPFELDKNSVTLRQFRRRNKSTYFFDLYQYIRFFPKARFCYQFGDVQAIPDVPSFVKSRPIKPNNQASILMNLNKIRHFIHIQDPCSFYQKKPLLVWRGGAYQEQRIRFLEQYANHPRCDIGQTNRCRNAHFLKNRMTLAQQLQYKFVLSLEGNDVASNLKWIMSSNSLAVMPKPKFETWFMEGRLKPGIHYVEIREDYADLEEKMDFYLSHPIEAEAMIENAQAYASQFQNEALENTIAMRVIDRYLRLSVHPHILRMPFQTWGRHLMGD